MLLHEGRRAVQNFGKHLDCISRSLLAGVYPRASDRENTTLCSVMEATVLIFPQSHVGDAEGQPCFVFPIRLESCVTLRRIILWKLHPRKKFVRLGKMVNSNRDISQVELGLPEVKSDLPHFEVIRGTAVDLRHFLLRCKFRL